MNRALELQLLLLAAEHTKVRRPAAHAHPQVAVFFRLAHGRTKLLRVGHGEGHRVPGRRPIAVVNYVSNSKAPDDLIDAEYVLVPVRIVQGLKPMHDLLIFQNFNTAEIPEFEGYTLKKNYGNGVMLFERVSD